MDWELLVFDFLTYEFVVFSHGFSASGKDSAVRSNNWRFVADAVYGQTFPRLMPTLMDGGCTEVPIPCVVCRSAGVNAKWNV